MDDLKNVGESNYNPGDGTDQRVQSLVFMMMMKIINRNKNIRENSDFKKGYHPRTNIVKDEKGDSVTDSLSILVWWRKHFSQLFSAHGVSDVKQREIHTAVPRVRGRSAFEL